MKQHRNIIQIDRERCNGCGRCVLDCAEGAIAIIDGKATVVSDSYCDGLGACLSGCPQNALTIVRREADAFDEKAATEHAARRKEPACAGSAAAEFGKSSARGCPGTAAEESGGTPPAPSPLGARAAGMFAEARRTWPVKLRLVPASAPFLRNADILLAADCGPAASPGFHSLAQGRVVLIACPKFEDNADIRSRLTSIFTEAKPASVTVVRMEVPCCHGLADACRDAAAACGIPLRELVMRRDGVPA